jgi:hypothetical protein
MNRRFTKLMSVCIGMAFCAVPMAGQKRVEAAVKGEIREVRVLESASAKAPEMQLRTAAQPWPDSTITYDAADRTTGKTVYTYDAGGNQTLRESYKWEGNKWVIANKYVSTYDDAGNETLYEGFEWENDAWVGSFKYVYAYDAAGHETFYEYYNRWENNAWVGSYKHAYTYDNRGEEISSVEYKWENNQWAVLRTFYYEKKTVNPKVYVYHAEYPDGFTVIWISDPYYGFNLDMGVEDKYKYEYKSTYDANGNLTLVETSGLTDGHRNIWSRYIIKYENNNPVSIEQYDSNNNIERRATYKYDARGNITLFEYYDWDYDKNALTLRSKRVNAYDAAGRTVLTESYDDSQGTGQWVSGYKYAYTYDTNGNRLSYEYYSWDTASKSWAGSSKYDYLINEQGRTVKSKSYSWVNKKWDLTSYTVYYPNSLPNGGVINEAVTASAPTAYVHGNVIYIQSPRAEQVVIYSLTGAKVYEGAVQAGTTTVNADRLPKGVYIVAFGDGTRQKVANN